MNQIPKKNIEDFFNILGFYGRQKNFFLMLSSHFTALDLYVKRILNINRVISLSLICQAQGKDREDFKNCSFGPSIILVSIPYPDKR